MSKKQTKPPGSIYSYKTGKTTDLTHQDRNLVEKRLQEVAKEVVVLRDKKCVCCGSIKGLQAGHFYDRGNESVKWDLRNIYAQCQGCNSLHRENKTPMKLHVLKVLGDDGYEQLAVDMRKVEPIKVYQLVERLAQLKLLRDQMKGGE